MKSLLTENPPEKSTLAPSKVLVVGVGMPRSASETDAWLARWAKEKEILCPGPHPRTLARFSQPRCHSKALIGPYKRVQFALESDEWSNGVFTYSMMEALRTGKADMDYDRAISISELRDYVIKRVTELTGGAQKPTMRRGGAGNDFIVY